MAAILDRGIEPVLSSLMQSLVHCSECHGTGLIDTVDNVRCAGCEGSGNILGNPCDCCQGNGTVEVIVKSMCPVCFHPDGDPTTDDTETGNHATMSSDAQLPAGAALLGWIDHHPSDHDGPGYTVLKLVTGMEVAWNGHSCRSLPQNWRDL